MRKSINPGTLLKKSRRQHKGETFTVTNIVDTRKGKIYIIKCYKTGKTKALRHSSLTEYRMINR